MKPLLPVSLILGLLAAIINDFAPFASGAMTLFAVECFLLSVMFWRQ